MCAASKSGGRGKAAVRRGKRAQILLAASAGATDEGIAANVRVGTSTVYRTKRRFVEEGLEEALSDALWSQYADSVGPRDDLLLHLLVARSGGSAK